jgi:glycosyltransferase involved in cell wall biosynthesis
MKILIYDWALHTIGGGQKFDCKVAEYLSKKHEVDILSLFPVNRKRLEEAYQLDLSKIGNFKYLYKKSKINPNLLHLFSFKKISRIAKEYDLFYNAEEHETVKPTAKYNIIYCHFFGLKWPKPAKNLIEFVKLLVLFLIKSCLKNHVKEYDRIYCNSFYTKKWLKRIWKIDAEVIYPPINIPKKVCNKKKKVVLSVGRLTPDKNYEFTIECFKEIYDSGIKDYECWIYGSNPPAEYYTKLKKLSEGYPIKILSNPTGRELEKAYNKAKIFVQAKGYGIDEEKYPALLEHFGMTVAEAMAHCCVPVVLDKGGYRESIENNKNGFLFNTKKEAVEKIRLLINDKTLFLNMSKNARERAKKFSLERLHKELDNMLRDIENIKK